MSLVDYEIKDNVLYLTLPERIDSNNAEIVGHTIRDIAAAPHDKVVADAANLVYISSAGLRVMLKMKKANNDLKIINVSSEVYEIFEMTGFTEMIDIEKAYKQMSVEGCPIIGKGAKGTVYRYNGDTVIKVYNDRNSLEGIKNERNLARTAFVLGIPTAISFDIVKVGDKFGSVFELLDAKSLNQMMLDDHDHFSTYVKMFADMLYTIHHTEVAPDSMPNVLDTKGAKWLKITQEYLSSEDYNKFKDLYNALSKRHTIVHGDYHTHNIMLQNGEPIIIDMDTLSYGHPIFDLASVAFSYKTQSSVAAATTFFNMPLTDLNRIWDEFLPYYLRSDDKAYIESVKEKCELVSYIRDISHSLHHPDENSSQFIKASSERIHTLLNKVDSLDF